MTIPQRSRLNDFCSKGLLRKYRGEVVNNGDFLEPKLSSEDIEDLRIRWALSSTVGELATYILDYPRVIQSSLNYLETLSVGEVLGAIDARSTVMEQTLRADPSVFVALDASASYENGPNHLVAWVIREAEEAVMALLRRLQNKNEFLWVHERAQLLDMALRNQTLHDVSLATIGWKRPGLAARRSASRSNSILYRLALKAYESYEGIESLDADVLGKLMRDTFLAPLEDWRLLELSTALAVSEALANECQVKEELRLSTLQEQLVSEVGPFQVIWQRSLPSRNVAALDKSEALAKEVAQSIGTDIASSRVDVCVVHRDSKKELAHFECKWFENERSARSAISDAAMQVTRYARDSRPSSIDDARALLQDSIIVVSTRGKYTTNTNGDSTIGFTDFEGLESGDLRRWARAFASRHRSPT